MRAWILRIAVALGLVLAAVTCSFDPKGVAPPSPNSLFVGCYQGVITNPAGSGSVTLVLEGPADSADQLTLGGCLRSQVGGRQQLATLAGTVLDVREQAKLVAMPTAGDSPFDVTLVRRPAGNVVAEQIDATADGSSFFITALNLPRCPGALSCSQLALAMRPVPQPVLELP